MSKFFKLFSFKIRKKYLLSFGFASILTHLQYKNIDIQLYYIIGMAVILLVMLGGFTVKELGVLVKEKYLK
jgi:uncharacterized membrane protein YfcA